MTTDAACHLLALPVEVRLRIYDRYLAEVAAPSSDAINAYNTIALVGSYRQIFNEAIQPFRLTPRTESAIVKEQIAILDTLLDEQHFEKALPLLEFQSDHEFANFCRAYVHEVQTPKDRRHWLNYSKRKPSCDGRIKETDDESVDDFDGKAANMSIQRCHELQYLLLH